MLTDTPAAAAHSMPPTVPAGYLEVSPPPPLSVTGVRPRGVMSARMRARVLVHYIALRELRGQRVRSAELYAEMGVAKRRWYDFAAVLRALGWGTSTKGMFTFETHFDLFFAVFQTPPPPFGATLTIAQTTYTLMHQLCTRGRVVVSKSKQPRRVYDVLLMLEGLGVLERMSRREYCAPSFGLI